MFNIDQTLNYNHYSVPMYKIC